MHRDVIRESSGRAGPWRSLFFQCWLTAPAEKTDLPVGEVLENGAICPFWYELREIEAPSGYERNPEVFCWQFAPDTGVVSYPWNGQAQYQITVTDRKPRSRNRPARILPNRRNRSRIRQNQSRRNRKNQKKHPVIPDTKIPKLQSRKFSRCSALEKFLPGISLLRRTARGWLYLGPDGYWRMRLPKMGDIRQTRLFAGLFILAAAGLGLAGTGTKCCGGFRGRRRKKKWKK